MPNYNLMSPFGNAGPQYNIVNQSPIGGLTTGAWPGTRDVLSQEPNPEATWNVNQQAKSAPASWSSVVPVISPTTGLYVHPTTGQPYTGADPQGNTYQGGKQAGQAVPFSPGKTINPNDPNQRYAPVNIVKSPEIATGTQGLMDTFTKTASTALDDFSKYLSTFKDQIGGAAAKTATATDIGPVSNSLRNYQTTYSNALNQASGDYRDLNARTAANEAGIVKQAQDLIPEYDNSINRLRDYQSGQLQSDINARYAAGGTPRSMGSGLARELLRGESAITVPLEQAKIQQKYNVLSQYAMPATLDAANRETARIANFDPMVAAQQFQSGQATEQTIQGLAMTTANMSYDNAMKYMQSLGVPAEIQQKILSGEIGQLSGLNQLYTGSRYQGLQDVLGANVTPTASYNMGVPGYPGGRRTTGPDYTGLPAKNAPVEVGPGGGDLYPGSAYVDGGGKGSSLYPGSAIPGYDPRIGLAAPDYSNYPGYEVASPQDVAQVNYAA